VTKQGSDSAHSKEVLSEKLIAEAATRIVQLKDSVASIKTSAMRFLSGTALSRISGMTRDMILAFCFGTNEALAALFVAFRLSHMCRRIFGEGPLQSAFIPIFEELRKKEPTSAFRFFRDTSALLTVFLTSFSVVVMLGLAASLWLFNWSPGNQEIVFLMIILIPSLIPICLFGMNSSLLQCQKHYFTPGIAPAFFNILIAAGALCLRGFAPKEAMPWLAVSIVLGCTAQWFATVPLMLKNLYAGLAGKFWDNVRLFSPELKLLGTPLILGLIGVGASQVNNAVDAVFARYADPEGPAQLWYGLRLLQLPLALFGIAIAGALLPPLARSVQSGNKEEYLHFLEFAIRRVSAFLMPCMVILSLAGTHVINLLFGYGDFQAHSILTTTGCLHGYILGLLPMGLIIILAPACYAHKDFKAPMWGAILSMSINIVFDATMVFGFGMKAVSVALATSIASWVNVFYLYKKLERHSGHILTAEGASEGVKAVSVALLAGVVTWCIQQQFFYPASFFHWSSAELATSMVDKVAAFALPCLTYIGLSFAFAKAIRAKDTLALFGVKTINAQ